MHIIFCEEGEYFSDYTLRKMTDDLSLVQEYIEGKEEIRTSSVLFVRLLMLLITKDELSYEDVTFQIGDEHSGFNKDGQFVVTTEFQKYIGMSWDIAKMFIAHGGKK